MSKDIDGYICKRNGARAEGSSKSRPGKYINIIRLLHGNVAETLLIVEVERE